MTTLTPATTAETPIQRRSTAAAVPGTTPRPVMLRVNGLSKRFGSLPVVNGVDLIVEQGDLVALLGPSGCGKTTTLRLIAGFEEPDTGVVEIAGRLVVGPHVSLPPERRRVGMVFQDYALFPHLTVGGNVAFGLPRSRQREQQVATALTLVGLDGLADRMPHQLSGGQQQRVALARALAPEPEIILLDEPFSNLDPELRAQVRADVRDILRRAGATAILVTHDQEEALSLADRIAVMFRGQVVQMAGPEELYHRPVDRRGASFVGEAQFLPGESSGRRVATELGELPLANAATGHVDILLRPEMVRLRPIDDEGTGAPGIIRSRRFFGHDQVLSVELDSGQRLDARLGSYSGFRTGDRVRLSVRGAVLPFPRNESEQQPQSST